MIVSMIYFRWDLFNLSYVTDFLVSEEYLSIMIRQFVILVGHVSSILNLSIISILLSDGVARKY